MPLQQRLAAMGGELPSEVPREVRQPAPDVVPDPSQAPPEVEQPPSTEVEPVSPPDVTQPPAPDLQPPRAR